MRREHWILAIAASGLLGGGMLLSLLHLKHAEALDHFGGYLAGLAAFLGVGFAAIKGSQEFDDWKNRKRHEKEAEVAAATIVAAIRLSAGLRSLATFLEREGDPVHSEAENYREYLQNVVSMRVTEMRDELNAYGDAQLAAAAHLPEPALQLVRDFWALYLDIRIGWFDFSTFAGTDVGIAGQREVLKLRKLIDPKLEALINELRRYTVGGVSQPPAKQSVQ